MRTARGGVVPLSAAVLGAAAVVSLAAGPAGATSPPARPGPAICTPVQNRFARIVTTNNRAKAAFQRASALQARLVRQHRVRLAHRLDARLEYLRDVHTTLVARVSAIAARIDGVCSLAPPTLESY